MFLLFALGLRTNVTFADDHIFTFFDRVQNRNRQIEADTVMKLRAHLWAARMSAVLTEANVMGSIAKTHEMSNRGLVFESIGHEVHTDISDITGAFNKTESLMVGGRTRAALKEMESIKRRNQALADKIKRLSGQPAGSGYMTRTLQEEIERVKEYMMKYAALREVGLDLQTQGEIELQVYPPGIDQVVTNLALNAIDQISQFVRKRGKVLLRIGEVDAPDRPIRILVLDNGPGIHRSDWGSIFEPGYTTKPEGSGLGLAIAKRLVESMGGRIRVKRSIVFVGTAFEVELPRAAHYGTV
jgi:signal transduction histidine kinase